MKTRVIITITGAMAAPFGAAINDALCITNYAFLTVSVLQQRVPLVYKGKLLSALSIKA